MDVPPLGGESDFGTDLDSDDWSAWTDGVDHERESIQIPGTGRSRSE